MIAYYLSSFIFIFTRDMFGLSLIIIFCNYTYYITLVTLLFEMCIISSFL